MASADQIAELRRKISEPDTTTYSDVDLSNKIDAAQGDVDQVASDIWTDKASMYAELVDTSEAGSSRKNSQLMKQALDMANFYGSRNDTQLVTGPTTRPIVRA